MSIVKFSELLNEAMKSTADTTAKRTHLEHPEDLAFDSHESVGQAENHLRELHNHLLGKKSKVSVSTKYDGAPAVHVGMDKDGNYFAATKGLFNKNPKVYRNDQEVDDAYGAGHPVGHILKQVLRHAPSTMPRDMKPGEIYKGDVLSVKGGDREPKREGGFVTTQPNVLKYKYPVDSQEGRALARSQLGVVWHTKYDRNGNASSISTKDRAKFVPNDNIFTADPDVKSNPANYSPEEQSAFENHMENARREYGKIQPETYDKLTGHNDTLRTYINQTVRSGEAPSFEGYTSHLAGRQQKDVDSVKTQAAKDRKVQQHADFIQQAHTNRKDIEGLLKLHGHLQAAKNVLVGVADKNSPSTNELPTGESFGHEGYVTNDKQGGAVKMVDRRFSQALLNGLGAISQAKTAPAKPMNEETDPNTVVPHTVWYGRGQGLHDGHVMGAKLAMDDAGRTGGGHSIIFTHTHDKNNPLTPEQKLYYAKRGLPQGANVTMTNPQSPSLLQQAADLHKKGVTQLRIVAGSDRIPQYKSLFDRYNGVFNDKGEGFNFRHGVVFIPAGDERKGDGDAVSSFSGSGVRKAAAEDDAGTFNKMTSSLLSPADKDQMRADIKAGMAKFAKKKKLTEGYEDDEEERRQASMNAPETPISSFLKKNTPIGTVDELGSALHKGDVKGAILPAAKLGTLAIPSAKLGMLAGGAVGAAEVIRDKMKLKENLNEVKTIFKKVISKYTSTNKSKPIPIKQAAAASAGVGGTTAALVSSEDDQPKSQAATPPNPPTIAGSGGTAISEPLSTKLASLPSFKDMPTPPVKDAAATSVVSQPSSKSSPSKSNREFYDRMTQAGVKAGMSDTQARQMASLSALESGWGRSSMTSRANNPFGQTITSKQIGTNGIVGGTRGADGQLHAVYDSPESAVAHHFSRWGKNYTDDHNETYSNLAKQGYNTVNPAWAGTIGRIHSSMNAAQDPEKTNKATKIDENTTGSVGGLGFNTGNPAPDGDAMQQYIDTNGALAKDDENGNLIKAHNALHAPLGFKEFDPKKDLAKGNK